MRTTVKIPMKTADCEAVISTIEDKLDPHKYTRLDLRDITVWHKGAKYFAVSFQNDTAYLQGWLETHPSVASNEPRYVNAAHLYQILNTEQEEISLHSLRRSPAKKKLLKLLSELEVAILEKNL